jgi:hydroxymethylpyrimidine pyrophosphatase-like HAD family hydrolase
MKFESKLTRLAGAYYTDEKTVIFAYLVAGGITPATAYYFAYHKPSTITREENEQEAKKTLSLPYVQELINTLKEAKKTPLIVSDGNKQNNNKRNNGNDGENNNDNDGAKVLQSVDDVRDALASIAQDITGKDKAAVLVQLAKMLPEEEKPEEERVKMYLPFNSDCRACLLWQKAREKGENI